MASWKCKYCQLMVGSCSTHYCLKKPGWTNQENQKVFDICIPTFNEYGNVILELKKEIINAVGLTYEQLSGEKFSCDWDYELKELIKKEKL